MAVFLILAAGTALPAERGFVDLLGSGKLDAWRAGPKGWVLKNGVLALEDRTDGKMMNANYLWTREQYGDFVLELEYRVMPERANSGVFIRAADPKDPVQTGIEIQVGNASADRPPGRGTVGGIYDLVAPSRNAHKSGEWNRYVITCRGGRITVVLNGVTTAEADLDRWTEPRKNPDGSPNKFRKPLKEFARVGYIGLQDHGSPVWYRRMRVKRLD